MIVMGEVRESPLGGQGRKSPLQDWHLCGAGGIFCGVCNQYCSLVIYLVSAQSIILIIIPGHVDGEFKEESILTMGNYQEESRFSD